MTPEQIVSVIQACQDALNVDGKSPSERMLILNFIYKLYELLAMKQQSQFFVDAMDGLREKLGQVPKS